MQSVNTFIHLINLFIMSGTKVIIEDFFPIILVPFISFQRKECCWLMIRSWIGMIQLFHWSLDLYWRIFLSLFPHCLLCITHTCLLNDNLFIPEWQSHPQEKEDLTSMIHKVKISLYMYSNCCIQMAKLIFLKGYL